MFSFFFLYGFPGSVSCVHYYFCFFQVNECEWASGRISEMISLDGESDQKISSCPVVPSEFFEDMESSWKGRVKRVHIEEEFSEVEKAAQALSLAVSLWNKTFHAMSRQLASYPNCSMLLEEY
jgi:hypothetical protein